MKARNGFFLVIVAMAVLGMACSGSDDDSEQDEYAFRMQTFVTDISIYARQHNNTFIIIPQNGIELVFNNTERGEGIMTSYVNAIDGIGVEELFFNGSLEPDGERLAMLRFLLPRVPRLKIMVSEFVSDNAKISDAIKRNKEEGFISFTRSSDNYDYKFIPSNITDENPDDVEVLSDAKNYLYLISTDNFSAKQEMINAVAATNYDLVLIDLFFKAGDDNLETLNSSDICQLKEKANGGKRLVIAYVSIGSAENFRYYWKPEWQKGNPSWIKKDYEGYGDEYWVEFWHSDWRRIIFGNDDSYIKKIIDAGFDGAYLDNVEAYFFLSE